MRVEMYSTHQGLRVAELRGKTVVVVDALRTASTVIQALSQGCREVVPVADVENAMSVLQRYGRAGALLGGARNGNPISGFDLGDSPLEYREEQVRDKVLIYTADNGSAAIEKALSADKLYLGAFLNVSALAEALAGEEEVVLLCAGTAGRFSLDDVLAGGCIIDALSQRTQVELGDLGLMAYRAYRLEGGDLLQSLSATASFTQLQAQGYGEDIAFCLRVDALPVVPVLRDNVFVQFSH